MFEERKTLRRERCFFVTKGLFKELDCYVNTYSIKRMLINIDFYDVFTFPQYVNENGDELKIYAPKMFIEHISKIVDKLVKGDTYDLHDGCDLMCYLRGRNSLIKNDYWLDCNNDFFIFFGKEKEQLLLETMNALRKKTIGKIEVGDWDKLSEYYSLTNQDLDSEITNFLKPKKAPLYRALVRALYKKIEKDSNK